MLTRPAPAPSLLQLNQQIAATQDQAAACAAGGALQAYNPMWAPWPTHAWPDASSNTCTKMQAHATYIQSASTHPPAVALRCRADALRFRSLADNNQAQIAQIQQTSNAQGC